MAHYVVLGSFTEQGIRSVKDTAKRAQAFRDSAKAAGVTIKDILWTLGHYDIIVTAEAPSDEVMTSLMLKFGSVGNIKSQTLRAFDESEIGKLLPKM